MSFSIVFKKNESEKNKVDKRLTDVTMATGTLRSDASIVDPVITIAGDLATLAGANYMTIEAFGRSYFITGMRSIRTGLVEVSGHCDVLSSFKTAIRQNHAIVRRQENNWNLYLNDGSLRVYQNPNVFTHPFPSGFNTFEFVLAVAGR